MNYLLSEPTIAAPTTEPVTLAEARAWIKLDASFTDDDALIEDVLIPGARSELEKYTTLLVATREVVATVQVDGSEELYELPYGPVSAITSVTLKAPFQVAETLTEGTDFEQEGDRIRLLGSGIAEITYDGGFETCPQDLKEDILRIVAWKYQNRGIRLEADTDPVPYPGWTKLAASKYMRTVI
jgi:uncharacterized phiE125 gp8 family phage protein